MTWFEDGREQTGVMLLRRLQTEHPGVFDDNLLRTLQRRLGQWRAQKAQQLRIPRHGERSFHGIVNTDSTAT